MELNVVVKSMMEQCMITHEVSVEVGGYSEVFLRSFSDVSIAGQYAELVRSALAKTVDGVMKIEKCKDSTLAVNGEVVYVAPYGYSVDMFTKYGYVTQAFWAIAMLAGYKVEGYYK